VTSLADLGPLAQLRAGRLPRRLAQLLAGLVIYGASLALMVRGGLGLAPWDVLHSGIARWIPLTLGQVVVVMSFVVLLAWIPLREVPGVGTVANALVVGTSADATLWLLGPVTADGPAGWAARVGLTVGGVALCAFATALYIGAQLGRGPRDGLMTGLARRTGLSLRLVRTGLEVAVVLAGLALGGRIGAGTVLFALAIGPLTQRWLPGLVVRLDVPETPDVPEVPGETAQRLVAMSTEASEATITSTVVNRSSVSQDSRSVSTRP
jgi:uncharacterized membrane protein YczE